MANHAHQANMTRTHWGANANTDIHMELLDSKLDTAFQYNSIFRSLSAQRSTSPNTNTYRIDRMGSLQVNHRVAGEKLEDQRVLDDKLTIVVSATSYVRVAIDYQDGWTSPDRWAEIGQNAGTEIARDFDTKHIVQLQKARLWRAPAHLKGTNGKGQAFYDGIEVQASLKQAAATQADLEANAYAIEQAHKASVESLITRRANLANMVTLVTPALFSALTHHPKLMNSDFTKDGNDFGNRRVVRLNGIRVIENTEFPTTAGAVAGLKDDKQAAVTLTADDLKCEMITFDTTASLVTVTAKELQSKKWSNDEEFCDVLDMFTMYTVGTRRPDTVAVVKVNRA